MAGHSAVAVFLLVVVVAISTIGAFEIDFSEPEPAAQKDHHAGMWSREPGMFEGDMLISDEQKQQIEDQISGTSGAPDGTAGKAVRASSYRWTDNTVPYEIDSGIASETEILDRSMRHWELRTCIRFVQRTDEDNYVRFIRSSGCWSYVGMIGGRQDISIGNGCQWLDIVVHELGHALGFFHEQSRPDRDEYIVVHLGNMPESVRSNFNKYTTEQINTHEVPYDIGSVMHYSGYAFSNNGQPTITVRSDNEQDPEMLGAAEGLSCADIAMANLMLSCREEDGWEDYECDDAEEGVNYEYVEEEVEEGSHMARLQVQIGDGDDGDERGFARDNNAAQVRVFAGEPYTVWCYSSQRVAESEYDETLLEMTLDGDVIDHDERLIYSSAVSYYDDSYNGENDGRPYIIVELTAHTDDNGKRLACTVDTTGDREVGLGEASLTLQVGCRVAMNVPCGGECLDDFDLICNGEEDCPGGVDEMDCDDRCDRLFDDEDGGEFTSHGGFEDDEDYANNLDCHTLIRAPQGKVVSLEFPEFSLEAQSDCEWDYVEVYEGSSMDGRPIGRFCGSDSPRRIVSRGRELLVSFHTDSSQTDAGFLASYDFVDARDGGGNRTGVIDAYAGAFNGFVDMRVPVDAPNWRVTLTFDRKLRSLKITGTCEAAVVRKRRKATQWIIENKPGRGGLEGGEFLYIEFTAITSPSRQRKGAHAQVVFERR